MAWAREKGGGWGHPECLKTYLYPPTSHARSLTHCHLQARATDPVSPATLPLPALPLCPQIPGEAEIRSLVCCLRLPHQPLTFGPIAPLGGLCDLPPEHQGSEPQAEGPMHPSAASPPVGAEPTTLPEGEPPSSA